MAVKVTLHFPKSLDKYQAELSERKSSLMWVLFRDKPIKRLDSGEYRIGANGSLSVKPDGFWYSHEDEEGGALLKLIQYALRCSFAEAIAWADKFIADTAACDVSPSRHAKWGADESLKLAKKLWNDARKGRENLSGPLKYLRRRGVNKISPAVLRQFGYLPRLQHTKSGKHYPCFLVRLGKRDGSFAGVLRIYLSQDFNSKAPVDNPKMALGTTKGAAMQLTDAGTKIYVTEGLEDALSLLAMFPEINVWAYAGASITQAEFPSEVRKVVIATDNDAAGRKYRQKLAERLMSEGYRVAYLTPHKAKDFNEMLLKGIFFDD